MAPTLPLDCDMTLPKWVSDIYFLCIASERFQPVLVQDINSIGKTVVILLVNKGTSGFKSNTLLIPKQNL